eukprot:GEMP01119245.1.p1 GENE.GEMP01119245.1~~GEMP01119245.1.p1  ORF type:complete len:120 (-),score=16.03 GEMP01119245.1:35-394(-)
MRLQGCNVRKKTHVGSVGINFFNACQSALERCDQSYFLSKRIGTFSGRTSSKLLGAKKARVMHTTKYTKEWRKSDAHAPRSKFDCTSFGFDVHSTMRAFFDQKHITVTGCVFVRFVLPS